MDAVEWADDHWILLYFGADLVVFLASILLWKPGTRPIAGLLFVLALILPLAFLTVLFTNWVLDQDDRDGTPRRRTN